MGAGPADHDDRRVSKVAILMTDGQFNTAFAGGQVVFIADQIEPFVYAQLMTTNHKQSELPGDKDQPEPSDDAF